MYRLVSRIISEVSSMGPGFLVARFDKPFILLNIGYIDADGKVDYLSHEDIAKPATDASSEDTFTLRFAAANPLFFDPLGCIGMLGMMPKGDIDLPENTDTELHVETAETSLFITYLEKTRK